MRIPPPRPALRPLFVLLAAVALSACGGGREEGTGAVPSEAESLLPPAPAADSPARDSLADGLSPVEGIEGVDWTFVEPAFSGPTDSFEGSSPAYIRMEAGHAMGSGGCNRMMGSYTLDGTSLAFSGMAMTRMACDEPRNALESAIAGRMEEIRGWRLEEDGSLLLQDAEGTTLARLIREERNS